MGSSTDEQGIVDMLRSIVGESYVIARESIDQDYTHDESLTAIPSSALAVVFPFNSMEVSMIMRALDERRIPVVARGSGTGLSGASIPLPHGVVLAFDRMKRIIEIDTSNHIAVVEPGVTLRELDAALEPYGLVYPVYPGEMSASIGGNVATNAGGMRAVRYGVTRHHVLGLEVVLASGRKIRTGGKFVKSSSGYDLTQLLVGSEGTLALTTQVILKLTPRLHYKVTVLAPFATLDEIGLAIPGILNSGITPLILEYIDSTTLDAIVSSVGVDLGVDDQIRARALAYLVVVLESRTSDHLESDLESLGGLLESLGALQVYFLPDKAGSELIAAREKAFFVAKALGADDIIDTVVPRSHIPEFLRKVAIESSKQSGALVTGCGHVGDGNVHLSVFQTDPSLRDDLISSIFEIAIELGGAVSGEHGIGTAKQRYFLRFEDPAKVELMRALKLAFDPNSVLNPGRVLE